MAIGIRELNTCLLGSVELMCVSPASEFTLSMHRNHKLDHCKVTPCCLCSAMGFAPPEAMLGPVLPGEHECQSRP